MAERRLRAIVADDWWEWRGSVGHAIATQPDIELAGEAETAEQALLLVEQVRPDVLLADLELPEMGGVELTAIVRSRFPNTAVLVFTVHADERHVMDALRAGASGYLVKGETRTPARLCEAIRLAADGGALLTLRQGRRIVTDIARRRPEDAKARYGLTPRELEVLAHLARGRSNRQIATELVITEQSTKNHVSHILAKLGATSRAEAIARTHTERLIRFDPGAP